MFLLFHASLSSSLQGYIFPGKCATGRSGVKRKLPEIQLSHFHHFYGFSMYVLKMRGSEGREVTTSCVAEWKRNRPAWSLRFFKHEFCELWRGCSSTCDKTLSVSLLKPWGGNFILVLLLYQLSEYSLATLVSYTTISTKPAISRLFLPCLQRCVVSLM